MTVSASPIPLSLTSHNNQSLFSDHYLNDILRRADDWAAALAPAQEFLAWLRELYAQERAQLPDYKESQLEDNWFKPIFNRLGHVWEGQAAVPGLKRTTKKPDFVFFPDEAARKTAVAHQNSPHYAAHALAVGEVKQWEINLSKKTGTQPIFADQNPMYQIDTYLTLTGLEWGVLSNGRIWRLLHKSSSRTLETYFEIDLLAALEQPDETKATAVAAYFWLFFNQSAFRPDAHGRLFLNAALEQSRAYALALEADLRDNAYRALEQLILGFFAANPGLDAADADQRAQVYRHSLYLLYRLLFLFYGESRALLPMGNPLYKEAYSLQRLARQIDSQRGQMDKLPASGRRYWNRLGELFRLISGIDSQLNDDLGVPRYNGGLFDPEQHPFLENYAIGDRYLAQAIDYLAYRRVREDGRFRGYQAVDYRTLDVRQLGSIYEGLLEYKVAIAAEEMVTVRKKGVELWVPARSRGKAKPLARRPAGELYLATDKGERKATGSYYTPDYIVEYIVENTLGPLVAGARERVKEQLRRPLSLSKGGDAARRQKSADLFIAEILALNILDPAMGSGHFLVEATHYLARVLATDEYTQVADPSSSISSSISSSDLLYWKRRVVEACIYGVDKNPMAVELAKLSLWLKTAAADKPLSFLDHHLQCGDSLIGARLDDLSKLAKPARSRKTSQVSANQPPLFDESAFTRDAGLAVKGVMTIERLPTLEIEDVYAKEAAWQDIQQTHVGRWRRLADLWVSCYFGNEMTPEEYRALAGRLQGRESLMSDAQAERFLAHPAVTDNDYFHWELAFPEVFFDEYGRSLNDAAGFDAVIGNPPYISYNTKGGVTLSDQEFSFLASEYRFLANVSGRARVNALSFFVELGTKVVSSHKIVSFLINQALLNVGTYEEIREFVLSEVTLMEVVPDLTIEDIIADLCIFTYHNSSTDGSNKVTWKLPIDFSQPLGTTRQADLSINPGKAIIFLESQEMLRRIREICIPLGTCTNIARGMQITKEDFLDDAPKTPNHHPCVSNDNLARYDLVWPSISQLNPDHGRKPYIIFDKDIEQRVNARLANSGSSTRVAIGKTPERFLQQKILVRQAPPGDFLAATYDDKYFFSDYTVHIVNQNNELDLKYLLALTNSKLMTYVAVELNLLLTGENRTPQIMAGNLSKLPIMPISFQLSQAERNSALVVAKTHYEQGNHPAILDWTAAELAANRNDAIHDLLAFLAGQMIAMNKEKQAKLEAFWLDLEGVSDAQTFAVLRRKGKQQASLHKAVPAARPFVSAASRSSVRLDASLSWNEDAFKGFVKLLVKKVSHLSDIVQIYRQHAPGAARLTQRLAVTDRLIDQIVYQLYGLTAEEIAIVEGAA